MQATNVMGPALVSSGGTDDSAAKAVRKVHRVQLDLPKGSMDRLTNIKEMTDAASNAEVIRNAIRLYEAIVQETAAGREFFIKETNGSIIPYRMFI